MKYFIKVLSCIFYISFFVSKNNIKAQSCAGSWAVNRPISVQCITGQYVGQSGTINPVGCPTNPIYTAIQINTFTFASPVSSFFIDFIGFDGAIQCARMEVKVNGVFYALTNSNLTDLPTGSTCTASFSTISVTPDGYLAVNTLQLSQGRIYINNVLANSVTVSTNDGNGTVVSNPFGCTTVPLNLVSFSGLNIRECKAKLEWRSGIELNIKNIELLRSVNGILFNKVAEVSPKGDNSFYAIESENNEDAFFRLRINDLDGHYEYSEVIRVKSGCLNDYRIIPNPVSDLMAIEGLIKNENVLIRNVLGQVVLACNSTNNNKLNVRGLHAGLYYVQVSNNKMIKAVIKMVKN